MRRIVEITPQSPIEAQPQPPVIPKPPVVSKPSVPSKPPKKKGLTPEEIKQIIKTKESWVKRSSYLEKEYKRISDKYSSDLETWINKQDNLPDNDYGKRILWQVKKAREAPGKLDFYKKLLVKKEKQK